MRFELRIRQGTDSVMGGSTPPPYADYDSTHGVPIQQKRRKTGAFVLNRQRLLGQDGDAGVGDGAAFTVLGLQQLEAGALEGGAEAVFPGHTGGGGGVNVDDADLTGGDALVGQGIQHGLTGSLTGGGVVGGEGGLRSS